MGEKTESRFLSRFSGQIKFINMVVMIEKMNGVYCLRAVFILIPEKFMFLDPNSIELQPTYPSLSFLQKAWKSNVIEQFLLQGHLLQLEVEGTGFLYRQVRNMVGSSITLPS